MVQLTRRSLLTLVGTTVAAGSTAIAGCLGRFDDPTDSLPAADDHSNDCPDSDVDRLVAYREIDPDDIDIYLEPSTDSIDEGERIAFTLRNESFSEFSYNQYNWVLHKRVDGEWYFIAPREIPQPLHTLRPRRSYEWELSVDNAGIEDGTAIGGTGPSTARDPIPGLGGGEYAFGTDGWFDGPDEKIGFCARFELEADELELTPTDDVAETAWEDEVLVARSSRGDPDGDYSRLGAYELERIVDERGAGEKREGEESVEPLLTETVLRNDQLRDVLALAREYDADRVRLEEHDASYPIFGSREDGRYEYDGVTYEITTSELEPKDH
ncbi:hypothetical protein GS429_01265 [Natronorubrum sp. JWXQ-INN-674]|uniref:Uncharacterized protein n=1 Tax=Natronorubrum halalkaliphilum TaxID=2691917 RepID=A0A6B0VGR1_9EURY|nr:hypothetical protein [Natronorubrum halalkaliphilum]MXV60720.1 hypothetical protein [Natronorubrum halalkaliphilum]